MSNEEIVRGSGNVFADLGLPNPEEVQAKANLAMRIMAIIDERGLKQVDAAELLGIDQPKVSHLRAGRLSGFSTERLLRYLRRLGDDVEIVTRPQKRKELGSLHVSVGEPVAELVG